MKRKVARIANVDVSELAEAVAEKAKFLGSRLNNAHTPAKQRADAEQRLLIAWEALKPSQWSTATTQRAVLQALDLPWKALARGTLSEDKALGLAMQRLRGVQGDPWAPDELATRDAPESLILACLRATHVSRGRPRKGAESASVAQAKLFAALGIGGDDPRAVRKLRARSKKPTKKA